MILDYDTLLLTVSIAASTIVTVIAFSFLDRIYRSADKIKGIMPMSMSFAIGAGLVANHFIIMLAMNSGAPTQFSWHLVHSWLFATGIGACVVYLTARKNSTMPHILMGGVIGGLCDYGLFYTSRAAIYGAHNISVNLSMAVFATLFAISVLTLALVQFQWIKTYSGGHRTLVRTAVAFGISLAIVSVHVLYSAAFVTSSSMVPTSVSNPSVTKVTAIALALAMICLFLIAFLFVMLYEKQGKKLLNFTLFRSTSDTKNQQYSLQDSLTKLPNRRAFDSHLDSAVKRCERSGKSFALAYIDLDHFKPINDNYGHHVGDAMLNITAERLNTAIRGCDFVARIGGDEFVAILEEIDSEEDVRPIASRIVDSVKEPYFIDHLNLDISCSIGIAIYPKDGEEDPEKLMVCADAAMYKAKDQGKNQYKFYDSEIESAHDILLSMQNDLCQAIEHKEFSIVYLPKIDCKSLTAIGAEALIRWNHPTKGEIQPNDFLPAAEHFGLVQEINNWVIDECCSMLAHAKQSGLDLHVSVNLSSHQFRDPKLVKNIVKTIRYYDLDPTNISFEIKETVAINNQRQFKSLLAKFREAGIKVILDDFGLLPMSLTYLLDLDIDEVKIDRSFIAMINKDQGALALIDAIFKLTHALGFKATAEGIEDEAQQEAIIDLGCDYMQGYLFSKPIKEPELFELYQKLQFKQLQIDFGLPSSKKTN